MDFIDRIKQSWETLVKPYPINPRKPQSYLPEPVRSITPSASYSVESLPNLQEIIQEIGPLPPYSIIIGGCDDHSHLYMDLCDPSPGSILVAGDRNSGRNRLLDSILFSVVILNSPRRVRYAMIASDLSGKDYLISRPHCYKAFETDTSEAVDMIFELAEIADYRRNNQQTGSAILLAIDDLASLLSGMDEEMIEQLSWLIQVGPQVQIWTLATLDTQDVSIIDPNFLNHFGTRLIGSVESADVVQYLSGSDETRPSEVIPGAEFSVLFDEDWIKFWIPTLEEVVT
jgi:hypothetical protein